jgi:hypothetical protein
MIADPAARAGRQPADVVRHLHQGAGEGAQAGRGVHERVVRRERRELVLRRPEREPGLGRELRRRALAELRVRVETGADGGAADREVAQPGLRRTHVGEALLDLRDPAADLLAERDRCGVLQVGTADLDDVGERLRLRGQGVAQHGHARHELVLDLLDHGDVHRGRERVVRRLPAVHVVVRVHRLLRAHLAAGQLDRAVRDDLVRVHVRLRPRAGLEDDQREVVVELPGDHLVRGAADQVDLLRRQLAQLAVRDRGALLQDAERADDRTGEAEPVDADREVLDRPLRLGTPVAVGGNLDRTHRIGLAAKRGHGPEDMPMLRPVSQQAARVV